MNGDLDLPFELNPPGAELDLSDGLVAGGVVVLAATLTGPTGKMPGIVFRFANPDGSGFYPPITLILEEHRLLDVKLLVAKAVNASVKAAR